MTNVETKNAYDVAVVYRICPRPAREAPPVHPDDKYKMAEFCLRSFKRSLGSLRVKCWVLLDNCPESYADLFRKVFPAEDLVIVPLPGIGNGPTFVRQIEILSSQSDAELVYFAEDDYFYLPNRFQNMISLMRGNSDVDFCTPYDHPDYYNDAFHRHRMEIKVQDGQAWKTQNGTTLTFLTRKSVLLKTRKVLASFARGNTDAGLWLSLTKHHLFNPWDLLTRPFVEPFRGWSLACAWVMCTTQILLGRRYRLWVPVPSLGTHMVAHRLAPHVEWVDAFNRAKQAE